AEAWIARLHAGIEQAFLRGEQGAPAVHVNAAAFQHKAAAVQFRGDERQAESTGGPRRQLRVAPPVRIFCPGVEAETDDRQAGPAAGGLRFPADKDRPRVADPPAIRGKGEKAHAARSDSRGLQNAASRGPVACGIYQDEQDLPWRQLYADI